MVKKAKQTAKKTTKKNDNKKCPMATKVAIIALIASVILLAVVLIFVMVCKDKKQTLSCDYVQEEDGTSLHIEYYYGFNTGKPDETYQLFSSKAASNDEAVGLANLMASNAEDEVDYVTTKAWTEDDKYFVESTQNKKQIAFSIEDKTLESYSLVDAKALFEEVGYTCEVK